MATFNDEFEVTLKTEKNLQEVYDTIKQSENDTFYQDVSDACDHLDSYNPHLAQVVRFIYNLSQHYQHREKFILEAMDVNTPFTVFDNIEEVIREIENTKFENEERLYKEGYVDAVDAVNDMKKG